MVNCLVNKAGWHLQPAKRVSVSHRDKAQIDLSFKESDGLFAGNPLLQQNNLYTVLIQSI
ncbi:hypothetical protein MSG28_010524 [Choristoneura fumiferana]|uniref:Uncharacterized protein n=1 Tax=Choristoneura fumiferana TaxID=7141 RepID=A0ACC0KLG5_CHOFU|nr:hypothetical protein MSG28_010524 [Choristoneura fumiferana]